jgi:crotonobetainyl-CoA:carnitine CoA-transferase CaiB-like acyl-CoA transferase
VLEVSEVAADPQFAARGVVTGATHPSQGAFRQLAPLLAGMHVARPPSCRIRASPTPSTC